MNTADEKLSLDLKILEAMAAEMDDYLTSDVLFWPLARAELPRLTLGGYLMRQHRLMALRHLLTDDEQARLDEAISQFNQALTERIVRFEQRGHQELQARLRQWSEYLKDVGRKPEGSRAYYATAVETRAMIEALLDKLQMAPYELDKQFLEKVAVFDSGLRRGWRPGDFVWPEAWQSAYPRSEYWWLYGLPG